MSLLKCEGNERCRFRARIWKGNVTGKRMDVIRWVREREKEQGEEKNNVLGRFSVCLSFVFFLFICLFV